MTSLGNIVYLVKCLSKPYLKHFFDCKMFIAATSFNPPGTIFKQGSDKWQKITWIKYWIIPKRNYFQVACSILINILPKVSLIPNFTFSIISTTLSSFILIVSISSSCSSLSTTSSFYLSKRIKMIPRVLVGVLYCKLCKDQSKLPESPSSTILRSGFRWPAWVI